MLKGAINNLEFSRSRKESTRAGQGSCADRQVSAMRNLASNPQWDELPENMPNKKLMKVKVLMPFAMGRRLD